MMPYPSHDETDSKNPCNDNSRDLPRYSVAIRTLGLNPKLLKDELESIFNQTVKPVKVVIYIAEGYKKPDFRVADEEYVYTRKGMMTQRALQYAEISTPLILLLDDDVTLAEDSAERLIEALEKHSLDCISPDTFQNHLLPWKVKVYAALTNLTFPHADQNYAFKLRRNGSFAYLNSPKRNVYMSQSASGPGALWRKDKFLECDIEEETWLDDLGFPFNEDTLTYYKLHVNGGRLAVYYDAGVCHVGGQTSSGAYRKNPHRYFIRAKAQYLVWHRALYSTRKGLADKMLTLAAFWLKSAWMIPVHCIAAITERNIRIPWLYITGTIDGVRQSKSESYKRLKPYRTSPDV